MKIRRVHIDGFGKWHDQDFEFTDNPVLIYGANEAGKTTLAAFILSILFGFADGRGKNKYQQYLPKNGSGYGGSLTVDANHHQYVIKRVKGKNGGEVTITNEVGKREKAEFLTELIGPLDRELYQAIYSFNQNNILNDELDREQLEQQLQRLGAVGSQEWLQQIARLEKKAASLYKPRGRKLSLNRHLKEYDELHERVNQAQSQSSDYHRLVEEQTQIQFQLKKLQQEQPKLKEEVKKVERLQRLWPVFEQWRGHQQKAVAGIKLTDEKVVKIQEIQGQERELQKQIQVLEQQLLERQVVIKELSTSEVNNYREQKVHYQQLKDQLLTLQIQGNNQEINQQRQWQNELKQLEGRYGNSKLPVPLSEQAVSELEGLLNAISHEANNQSLYVPGIGIVLFIIGLIFHQSLIWILGIISLCAAGVLWFKQQQHEKQLAEQQHSQLRQFGKQHDLSLFPPDKWLTMQSDLHRYQDLKVQLEQVDQSKSEFNQRWKKIKRQLPIKMVADSINELINSYNRWLVEMQDRSQQLAGAEQEQTRLQNHLDQLKIQLTTELQNKEAEYKSLNIKTDADFKQLQTQRVTEQTRKITTEVYGQQLTNNDRKQLVNYTDKIFLDKDVSMAHQKLAANEQEQKKIETRLTQLKLQISSLVQNGSFSELNQQLANLQTIIWHETKQWLSEQLAIRWINGALKLASQDRYPKILQQAEKFFAILTNGRYQKIMVNDDGISTLSQEQQVFQVPELSLGTAEQLFISLRLGFITVISDQIRLPIMVDDGFVNFDNIRRGRMLELLRQMARENQVIYFTANEQIKELGSPVIDLDRLNKNKV
ncbi:ATP-binding protein [Limosilactobacillus fastidiosus]|uniref:AAA family ATPase n=1 Tax=Limosilactobacillus fastidiosus TaxID=2759855 RepID=A0A7W3YCK4_9LACO|nr:AAA family ATPase [Limosilactobacillus fastidiosus]MBB1063667.1 AAA family ATPase [Limosilactobacillus fastidiosus]MBB1086804.1 AAA family ATPase [Limosilactobacillus fastidiosus]MCD7084242.1 AAA family ATPase [Limosilactobacillus fastidiosus]MCD7085469.1 AAA family ATPase [Limosilactobacillus fastidiosus]MCD7114700.1 AAA family ATPase [Limosilactobacillus fastidiosus]